MSEIIEGIKLYSLEDTAEILSVSVRTVYNYLNAGRIIGQKIGGKWKISEANLKKFINGES